MTRIAKSLIAASIAVTVGLSTLIASPASAQYARRSSTSAVRINGKTYSHQYLRKLGVRGKIRPGNYWYDRRSGMWGYMGTGARGIVRPRLPFGKMRLPRTGTKVWINGREITLAEAIYLSRLFGAYRPGRYFINANGDAGVEGGPVAVNLIRMYQRKRRAGVIRHNGMYSRGGCAGGYCSFQSKITGKHLSWPR